MDSGLIAYLPVMFVGGFASSFALCLLVPRWRWWVAALLGALLPPFLLLVAEMIGRGEHYAIDAETLEAIMVVSGTALIPALMGALCGVWAAARAKRRQEF